MTKCRLQIGWHPVQVAEELNLAQTAGFRSALVIRTESRRLQVCTGMVGCLGQYLDSANVKGLVLSPIWRLSSILSRTSAVIARKIIGQGGSIIVGCGRSGGSRGIHALQ